jgi:hypothetical protein
MEFLKDLPVLTSFGQLFLIIIGIFIAIKYVLPLVKPNGSTTVMTTLAEIKTMTMMNTNTLSQLAEAQNLMSQVLSEIERRGRGQDEAIRKVMGR